MTVTHDSSNALVIIDGEESYAVQQSGDGGTAEIVWALDPAPVNSTINTGLGSSWPNFRGSNTINAVTSVRVPTVAEEGTLYWANQIGSGIDSDAVGSPILVGGDVITYASNKLFRVDTVTGEILATGYMDHKSSFSITPPTYAEGMVFVALSDGCGQWMCHLMKLSIIIHQSIKYIHNKYTNYAVPDSCVFSIIQGRKKTG